MLAVAALPALCTGAYLFWLILRSRRLPLRYGVPHFRYEIVIPAHNEESGVAATVESLRAVDYLRELFAVTVVADNCTDQTAGLAQEAGARVLSREDRTKRGKGYAFAYAFARILSEGLANALVVVGADTLVSPNLLQAFSTRLDGGAQAVQADYAVRNPFSWRTRLMTIALGSFDVLRSLAREAPRALLQASGKWDVLQLVIARRDTARRRFAGGRFGVRHPVGRSRVPGALCSGGARLWRAGDGG